MRVNLENVVTDYTSTKYGIGEQFTSQSNETCTIIGKLVGCKATNISTKYVVKFTEGQLALIRAKELTSGKYVNAFTPSVYGVGFMGVGDFVSSVDGVKTLEYTTWKDMIKRCYTESGKDAYADVTVAPEWHNFQNFAQWHRDNYVDGYHLDKDLLDYDARLYSPETCVMIPMWLNAYIVDRVSTSNTGFKGVIKCVSDVQKKVTYKVVVADFRVPGNRSAYIGRYDALEEAKEAYSHARKEINFFARQKAFTEGLAIELVMHINKG